MDKEKSMIKIGTLIKGSIKTPQYIERFVPTGIETIELFFRERIPKGIDYTWMDKVLESCHRNNITLNVIGFYANPLAAGEYGEKASKDWERIVNMAIHAGVELVSGFTGRIAGTKLEKSFKPVRDFFSPVIERLETHNMSLAFENCPMGGNWNYGDWNIAISPAAWDFLFNRNLHSTSLGIEFDPSHAIKYGQPVGELLRQWGDKIIHVHGKDAQPKDRENSVNGWLGQEPPYNECFPGEGDIDWSTIMYTLNEFGYRGAIDLEGYHRTFISHEREVEYQKKSIAYLKEIRDTLFEGR